VKIKTIGIIGLGRFGAMAYQYLKERCQISVYDADPIKLKGVIESDSLERTAQSDLLILTVPISEIQTLCRELSSLLRPGQIIVDACSVKENPVRWMVEELPDFVQVVGTHPLFGPDSGKEGIAGMKIAVCPIRIQQESYEQILLFLQSLELLVIETTPEDHDRQIAQSQAIFHLIAQAMKQLEWGVKPISTPGPETFYRLVKTVQKDTDQLFRDMEKENPYAAEYRKLFIQEILSLDEALKAQHEKKSNQEKETSGGK
jgi:prephenate dehydrogenase